MIKHNWTYDEDFICCVEYLAFVFDNYGDDSMQRLVDILALKLPQIAKGSIRMKVQNIKQIALDAGLEDRLSFPPLAQYSAQCKHAFNAATDEYFEAKERLEQEKEASVTVSNQVVNDPKVKPVTKTDIPRDLTGCIVTHEKFGDGKVVNVGKDSITVSFASKTATFTYPDSIGTHLKIKRVCPKKPKKPLEFNVTPDLGQSAHDAYCMLAAKYDWNPLCASSFEPKHLLYAKAASPEGYSVWFVAHSNYISDDDTTDRWKNTFKNDTLIEEWLPSSKKFYKEMLTDSTKRIVFAKKASGKYYFMGIYEVVSIVKSGVATYTKTYKRISTTYPESK